MNHWIKKGAMATAAATLCVAAWAQFASNMTAEQLKTTITTEMAKPNASLATLLTSAQQAGVSLNNFVLAAQAAKVSVADITKAVLTTAQDPLAALKSLGEIFKNDTAALTAVYSAAITIDSVQLDTGLVATALEEGSQQSGLATTLQTTSTSTTGTSSTTSQSNSSGSGSGGGNPASPTN